MTNDAPIMLVWEGDSFRPASAFWARMADKQFTIGQQYRMGEHNERSTNTHSHYFARLNEAWRNLPEDLVSRFPSVEHLRAYALIKAGYCNSHSISLGTPEAAQDIAAFMVPMAEFGIVDVQESVITVYTAKSQSYRAMERTEFQASKTAVLEIVSAMIGVTGQDLAQNAGKAA